MQSDRSVLYGLTVKTEWFIESFLVEYLLKNHNAKVDLYQRLWAGCVIPYQEKKKRRKHADYSQTLLILNRLPSESNEPKPLFH